MEASRALPAASSTPVRVPALLFRTLRDAYRLHKHVIARASSPPCAPAAATACSAEMQWAADKKLTDASDPEIASQCVSGASKTLSSARAAESASAAATPSDTRKSASTLPNLTRPRWTSFLVCHFELPLLFFLFLFNLFCFSLNFLRSLSLFLLVS